MSFLYINDPKKRNEIVADYLASVKKTRQQRTWEDEEVIESKKTGGLLNPGNSNPDFKFVSSIKQATPLLLVIKLLL